MITTETTTEPRRKLPRGWRWAKLGELIFDVEAGKSLLCEERPARLDEWGILKVSAVSWGRFRGSENKVLPPSVPPILKFEVKPGDFLISRANTTELVGAAVLVEGSRSKLLLSDKTLRLILNEELIDKQYLLYVLSSPGAREFIQENATGTSGSMKNISQETIRDIPLPLPPLPEQQRIAALLGEQMAAVERARAGAEARLAAARALPAAYLREVFEGEEAREWPKKKLGDISTLLPAHSIATQGEATVQAITTACLTEAGFDPAGIKTARMRADDAEDALVQPGEVLIARSNTPQLVGRVARYEGTPPEIVSSDLTIRIWPSSDVDGRFITYYLSSLFLSGYWQDHAGGASGSMKKITRSQLVEIVVPCPGRLKQQEVARLLEEKLVAARQSAEIISSELKAIEALPAALLRQAFSGELRSRT